MGWFRRKRDSGPDEARAARERAERELQRVKAETPVYEGIASSLRDLREANHFGMRIAALYRGEK